MSTAGATLELKNQLPQVLLFLILESRDVIIGVFVNLAVVIVMVSHTWISHEFSSNKLSAKTTNFISARFKLVIFITALHLNQNNSFFRFQYGI